MDNGKDNKKTHNPDGTFAKGNNLGNRFSKDNQPEKNGRKGKPISMYLKEIGEGSQINFNITITNSKGQKQTRSGNITTDDHSSINEVLANLLITDAIKGDHKARRELLDRTEGRPASYLDITSGGEVLQLTKEERENKIAKILGKLLPK